MTNEIEGKKDSPKGKKKSAPKGKTEKKEKKKKKTYPVPLMLETVFTFSKAVIVLVAGLVAVLSILSGCSPLWVAARTAAAIICVGVALWVINWLVARVVIDAEVEKAKKELEEQQKSTSTLEFKV